MGGSKDAAVNSAANLLRVCGDGTRGCHGMIESDRAGAYINGWLLRRGDPPTVAPVLLRNRWTLLTEDGQYVSGEARIIIQSHTPVTEVPW